MCLHCSTVHATWLGLWFKQRTSTGRLVPFTKARIYFKQRCLKLDIFLNLSSKLWRQMEGTLAKHPCCPWWENGQMPFLLLVGSPLFILESWLLTYPIHFFFCRSKILSGNYKNKVPIHKDTKTGRNSFHSSKLSLWKISYLILLSHSSLQSSF